MKKQMIFATSALLVIVALTSLFVLAQPNRVSATNNKAKEPVPVIIPAHAVELADGVFSLGTARDVDGKVVEGLMFIDYKKGYAKPPWAGGGGTTTSTCFAFLAKGARWKNTEPYVLNTTNSDGMTDVFVDNITSISLDAWDSQVAFEIFGNRNLSSSVDGADTIAPDNKNEVFFGGVAEPGVIAVTIVWGIFSGPPGGRKLVEFDAVFDDPDFFWGDAGPTSETALGNTSIMDYNNIAAHEFGHAGGMSHPSDSCAEETEYRFSQEGETKKRTLNAGDIDGIKKLYG